MSQVSTAGKRIRKGDKVVAIAGNYRGQTGTVLSRLGDKIVVQGLNIRKKHVKKTQQSPKGNIIEIEKSIHASNLKVCGEGDKPLKLKIKTEKDGARQLCYQSGDNLEIYRSVKKPH